MAGRSVWSDPEILELLAYFVPVADEVWRLKRKHDAEGDFFRRFCELGHYRGGDDSNNTRQGVYLVTPGGRFLASTNSRDPSDVASKMREGLALWKEIDGEERLLEIDPSTLNDYVDRLESRYPADGLVLQVFSRDLPRPDSAVDWRARAWNHDFAWFRKDEMLSLSKSGEVPEGLARWFARNHLLDNVRGQTEAFEEEDVVQAEISVCELQGDSSLKRVLLKGAFRMERTGHWPGQTGEQSRGVEASLLGFGAFDLKASRFTAFDAVALGTRWGATRFNGRHDDLEPSPIGWALLLARENAPHIAPAHLWDAYGW